jgi:hypothetical protein
MLTFSNVFLNAPWNRMTLIDSLISKRYGELLDTEHQSKCPWKNNSCPDHIIGLTLSPPGKLLLEYKQKIHALSQNKVTSLLGNITFLPLDLTWVCAIVHTR